MPAKKLTQYSFSRLDLYDKCPWAYKKVILEGVPRVSNEAMLTGKTVHALIADYLLRLISLKQQTDWEWAEGAAPKEATPDVLQIWQRFYSSFILPPALEVYGVEHKLAFDRNWQPCEFSSTDAYFRMIVDFHFRQGELGVVIDWKSNRAVPETVEKNMQLRTYGWGLKQVAYPDTQEILLRLHFLRYGKEREVLLEPQDLEGVPEILADKIKTIEQDQDYDPTPGSFCGLCGITAHCPVMSKILAPIEVIAPATREQAEKAASLLLTLQKMEKELTSRLKDWIKEYGSIRVGDMVYGTSPVVSYDLDPQKVTTILLSAGLSREEIWPLLSLTKTNLEKGLRKLKRRELLEQVLSTALAKGSEKIDFRKANS
ncbi:MAG: PD-(D/E)XK nuclease family protein [Syntrophales bacterium]|nr:PD-(D/E)XK nuclease family protein [Syntrophales bacterium]MDD5640361.1 PD-(D/E)XK nuclease family protein [Syntrophales bacterium]